MVVSEASAVSAVRQVDAVISMIKAAAIKGKLFRGRITCMVEFNMMLNYNHNGNKSQSQMKQIDIFAAEC